MTEEQMVWIAKRGRVYHRSGDCPWWVNAREFSAERGWTVNAPEEVPLRDIRNRKPCRVCVPPEKDE